MHGLLQLLSEPPLSLVCHFTCHRRGLTFLTPSLSFQVILWDCPPSSNSIVVSASTAKYHLTWQSPPKAILNMAGFFLRISLTFIMVENKENKGNWVVIYFDGAVEWVSLDIGGRSRWRDGPRKHCTSSMETMFPFCTDDQHCFLLFTNPKQVFFIVNLMMKVS